jgi:hypothetical protein
VLRCAHRPVPLVVTANRDDDDDDADVDDDDDDAAYPNCAFRREPPYVVVFFPLCVASLGFGGACPEASALCSVLQASWSY